MKVRALQVLGCLSLCHGGSAIANEPIASIGLTMEGGGWRAQTAYAGVVSGMLAVLGEEQGVSKPTIESTKVLDRFDHFSSVSGGSWFFASLAYSDSYVSLLEGMAASPDTAAQQMRKDWSTPILKAMNVDVSVYNVQGTLARKLADKVLGTGDADTLFMLTFFLSTNATWNAFTSVQLEAGASIGPGVLMGSDVVPWAKDKYWLCDHAVLLPTGERFARLFQTANESDDRTVSYVATSSSHVELVTPAQFSIQMGAGVESAAPHRYVAETAIPESVQLEFTGVVSDTYTSESSPLDAFDFSDGVLSREVGRLPVADAASASSAAAGIAPVLGILVDEALALVNDADLTPWFTNTGSSESLYTGSRLVGGFKSADAINQTSVQELATLKLHGLIDGGYTDDTGLSNVVAMGATEAVVLLDSNSSVSSESMELLFQGGPAPTTPGAAASPVFQESASYVRDAWQGFQRLDVNNTQFLTAVAVGTLTGTTVDNKQFGTTAGTTVTIHVIQLCGEVTIGFFENVDNYNTYTQEIIQTLNSEANSAYVKSTIVPMFMGSAQNVVQVI